MADRDAHLTDPAARDIPLERLLDRPTPRRSPRGSTRAGPPARPRHEPVRRRDDLARRRRSRRQCGQPDPVELRELRSGVARPGHGGPYQNRGSYFSLEPDHPNVLEPGKRTLHTLMPGMLFRDGWPAVGRGRLDGRRRPAADPRPARLGPGRRRRGCPRPRWRRRAGSSSRRPISRRRSRSAWSRASAGIARDARPLGHPVTARRRSTRSATGMRSSWSTVARRRRRVRWRPPPTRAATACRRSGRAGRVRPRPGSLCDTRAAGGGLRSHDAATGPVARPRAAERPVTSNVSQNYPYTSETEADRAAASRRLVAEREDLAGKLAAEATPLDAQRALVGLEVPDEGLPGPAPRRRLRGREARRLRRLRRDLRARRSCAERGRRPRQRRAGRRGAAAAGSRRTRSASRSRRSGSGSSTACRPARPASPRRGHGDERVVFAGAAQFAAVGYVASGLAWPGIILLTALLNARHLLYSAALAPWLRDVPFAPAARDGPPPDRRGVRAVDQPLPADRPGRRARLLVRRRSAPRSSRGTSRRSPGSSSAPRSRTRRGSASTSSSRRRWSGSRSG